MSADPVRRSPLRPMTKAEKVVRSRERCRARRREFVEYLGGKCVRCGVTEGLQFDHVDPKTKSFDISDGLQRAYAVLKAEVDKCQLLCEPHHVEKTAQERRQRELERADRSDTRAPRKRYVPHWYVEYGDLYGDAAPDV